MSLLLLCNEQAREGASAAGEASARLRDLGLEVVAASPNDANHADALIREHGPSISAVVVGGGDGTISGALPAILDLNLTLGILPLGTANDFARSLNIPEDVEAACSTIAAGRTRRVDVADVNGRFFANNATIGLPCEMAADVDRDAKKVLGPLASLALLPRVARYARPFRAKLISDGKTRTVRTNAIVIGNGRYDGGFPVKYEAIDDGLLNVAVSETRNVAELTRAVFAAWRNRADGRQRVTKFEAKELRIETTRPHRIAADGDVKSSTPATFRIHPGALSIFVP